MHACGVSRAGPRHTSNQDAWSITEPLACGMSLCIVSDGVGGRAAGEVASRFVAKALPALLRRELTNTPQTGPHACADIVARCVRRASRHLRQHAQRLPALTGMSATLAMLLLRDDEALVAHLGDSRVYQLRDMTITPLTEDHSFTANLVSMGDLRSSQAFRHPARHQLMRCLGMQRDPQPDVTMVHCLPGDRFLLCTDGVSKPLGDDTLRLLLTRDGMPETLAHGLLAEVDRRKGKDDATAVLVFV
ncbi:PP2C family protein-serine/threonine phosphatase [Megalodesulfovibrio gigas]|uniref:PPM-type phosphatase domain-containing protein n=1 Tax=Megalodesulfovibrio gigas (strain ATCC 19364 / DSM 1382 / NCIMB 9332 / VKM B-1759) TaxID=1121448 RepID=T2GDS1_MEGG1|nr:PP2C family serine/threonine-protein phosphatase [Megalodesulfovibrio gigas]AGW14725.1 putative protein serine/threonine phosphatase [Megalodesulfovibrio gigas DSM 1382 = ATCC 19364]